MKKIVFLSGIVIIALAVGCTKLTQLANINFNIPYSTQVTVPTVPGYTTGEQLPPGGLSLPFPSTSIATNSQQYLTEYHTNSANLVYADLQSMSMQIASPSGQDFYFLDTVQIYISAPSQPEILIAYEYNIPMGENTLNLITATNVNLKNYFLAETMNFRLYTHINAVPASGTQLNISSNFYVVANPLD